MNKFSKKELIGAIKNMKPNETNIVRQNGKIEVMAKGVEIETLSSSKEITLKSIYDLMINFKTEVNQKFESIDTRLGSLENEIKTVKEDVKNLDTKVTDLDTKVSDLDTKVNNLDTKLNKVIELNNLKF